MEPSPYFFRCDVIFDDKNKKKKTLYFAKFSFSKKSIFPWTAKAAVIRFEKPGRFSYKVKGNKTRSGQLLRKDQFMIVDGKIVFMASESKDYERTLIYQEKLQRRKTEFVLPEIVELMEKAQDQVIRANYKGSFLISGPAGSGKTTLALHRVAYLLQSPDTADLFPSERMIVFVQDDSTKKYFGNLLTDLGAKEVVITTFFEWVKQILELQGYSYINRFGKNETEKDLYELKKQ